MIIRSIRHGDGTGSVRVSFSELSMFFLSILRAVEIVIVT